jgi:hypothetical protein
MIIEIVLISFWPLQTQSFGDSKDFLPSMLVAVLPTLFYGYCFVVAGSVFYKVARRLNFISIEGETK